MAEETGINQERENDNRYEIQVPAGWVTDKGENFKLEIKIPFCWSADDSLILYLSKSNVVEIEGGSAYKFYLNKSERPQLRYKNPDSGGIGKEWVYTTKSPQEIEQLINTDGVTEKVPVNVPEEQKYELNNIDGFDAIFIPLNSSFNKGDGWFYMPKDKVHEHPGVGKGADDLWYNVDLDKDENYDFYFRDKKDQSKFIWLTGQEIARLVWSVGDDVSDDMDEKLKKDQICEAEQDESDNNTASEENNVDYSNVGKSGGKESDEGTDENIAKETSDNISGEAGDNNTEGSSEGNIEKEPEKNAEDVSGEEKQATTEEPEEENTNETVSEDVASKSDEDTQKISDETIKKQEDAINLFGYFFDGLSSNINTLNSQVHNLVLNESNGSTAAQAPKEALDIIQYKPIRAYKDSGKGELADYIFDEVSKRRPNYSRADILNIAICITQGFLTVFSGAPGCGKTSICDIFADVLGLGINGIATYSKQESEKAARYVSVSVEEGWTSKRDFIGYYNPLTGSMEAAQSNHNVYDVMEELNTECIDKESEPSKEVDENNPSAYPCIILLDEANLSPMEYYWSDFMKVGDLFFEETYAEKAGKQDGRFEPEELTKIYMGKRQDPDGTFKEVDFRIPDTLRFVATINNDYTTNVLSPRLTDRAWVITLPENQDDDLTIDYHNDMRDSSNQQDKPETGEESSSAVVVSMQDLQSAFDKYTEDQAIEKWNDPNYEFVREIYRGLVEILSKMDIVISSRSRRSILRYWATGADVLFDIGRDEDLKDEYKNDKEENDNGDLKDLTNISKHEDIKFEDDQLSAIIALDYAVSQRILPQIDGNGEDFGTSIRKLKERCRLDHLQHSYMILSDIWEKGNEMNYYKFYN